MTYWTNDATVPGVDRDSGWILQKAPAGEPWFRPLEYWDNAIIPSENKTQLFEIWVLI